MWGFGLMLLLLGIILVIVAPMGRRKNGRCTAETEAVLTNVRETETSENVGPNWYTFSYYVNGVAYEIRSPNRPPEAKQIGDRCTIWYNPAKPRDAMPVRLKTNKVYTILLIAGIVMIPVGFVFIGIGLSM